jgi:GDSL-like lipase/acylhydrolase family protein
VSSAPPQSRAAKLVRAGCLGLLALAVLGEVGVRVFDSAEGGTGTLYGLVVNVGSRFKMRSASEVLVPERYGDIRYRFNRAGYRDDEPRPGTRRILLLGDSVSFGLGIAQDRIYPALLERRCRRELGQPWEVENLAIFAYNTRHELETLETDGLALRPELVLVQFYMNDFVTPVEAGGAPNRVPAPPWSDRLAALKNRLLYSSALYRRLNQVVSGLDFVLVHDLRRRFPSTLNHVEARGDLAFLQAHPDDESVGAFRALRDIRDTARSHGLRTLVLVSPDEVQLFTRRYDGIDRRLAEFCAKEGIELYDALPDLRALPDRADLYLDGVHLTRTGHAHMTDLLFRQLLRRGLLGKALGKALEAAPGTSPHG